MTSGSVLLFTLASYAIVFGKDTNWTESVSDEESSNFSSSIYRHGYVERRRKWGVDVFNVVDSTGNKTRIKPGGVNVYRMFDEKKLVPSKLLTYPLNMMTVMPVRSFSMAPANVSTQPPSTVHKTRLTTKQKELLFTLLAVLGISILGLLGICIIRLIHKVSYDLINTFLVALAIGCLTGDALLHLLPHAFGAAMSHGHENEFHLRMTFSGLCTIAGMYLFLCCERAMALRKTYKEKMSRKRSPNADRTLYDSELENVNERLVPNSPHDCNCKTSTSCKCSAGCAHETALSTKGKILSQAKGTGRKRKVTSTAKLLMAGDAMHNFADGLAIGAAFAEHVSAGLCTAIAVVCHELPHEIGLFAVLLKTGMSVRLAVLANCFSSLMSIAGSMCGLYIGQSWNVSPWVFALIAGIFLYLALVGMLPELTVHEQSLRLGFLVENIGFAAGLAIMLIVAYYEKDIDSLIPHKS